MCTLDNLKENPLVILLIDFFLFLIITIVHFIFYFLIKETDFGNIFDTFESSPLFDFRIESNCGAYSHIIFHTWEGRKEKKSSSSTIIVDRTDINKINGYYFCYRHISYKDLLYRGQIIKREESCNDIYPKDCGTIDTLNQHLCIADNEKCPLYDVGIGEPGNSEEYHYNEKNSNIYYNNEKYRGQNKKIIGKLILNDGQPCYRLDEKLWRIFDSDEAGDEHLKCELEIFGKLTDDRYMNKGNITYKKLYENNLSPTNQQLIFDDLDDELEVSLFSREFLGIDKTCDEKSNINKDNYEKITKNQKMEKSCLLYETILLSLFLFMSAIILICFCCSNSYDREQNLYGIIICYSANLLLLLACVISQSVFLGRIINSDLSYDCSDDITNEVLRKENENTKKSIIYTGYNLGIDVFVFLTNALFPLILYIIDVCEGCLICKFDTSYSLNENENNHSTKNKNNSNNIPEEPKREVIVVNRKPKQENQINNEINNNVDTRTYDYYNIAPPAVQGTDSNSKV